MKGQIRFLLFFQKKKIANSDEVIVKSSYILNDEILILSMKYGISKEK